MANLFTKAIDYFRGSRPSEEGITSNQDYYEGDEERIGTIYSNLANIDKDGFFFWDRNYNGFGRRPSEYELLEIAYAGNPYVYTVISKIARKSSSLPTKIVDKNDPNREVVLPTKLQDLLNKPNPKYSLEELFYKIDSSYLVTGNGFFTGKNNTFGAPFDIIFVPVSRNVDIHDDDMGLPISYHIDYYDTSMTYMPENVLHLLVPDITQDYERGFSPLTAAREVYLANNALWSNERKLHEKQGANGFITADNGSNSASFGISPKDQEDDQKAFDRILGNRNFGKNILLKGAYKFEQMGLDPAKLKSVETKIDHLRTIAEIYDYPSVLAGDTNNSTYNNMLTARVTAMEKAILPMADYRLKNFSKWLIQDNFGLEDIEIIVDREKIPELNEVDKTFSDKVVQEVNTGILDINTARELIYPDIEFDESVEPNNTEDES